MEFASLPRERERKRNRPGSSTFSSMRRTLENSYGTHVHLAPELRPATQLNPNPKRPQDEVQKPEAPTRKAKPLDPESKNAYILALDASGPDGPIAKAHGGSVARRLLDTLAKPEFLEMLGKLGPNVNVPLLELIADTSYNSRALASEEALTSLAPRLAKLNDLKPLVVTYVLRAVAASYPERLSDLDFEAKIMQYRLTYG